MKLTDSAILSAWPKEKPYKIADGKSLYVMVMPSGGKYWRFKYRFHKKQYTLALGVYPDVSLKKARSARDEARALLKGGIDPMEIRREKKKNRPKPAHNKNVFNLSLSGEGVLTIETTSRIIHLTAVQTETLRNFLKAASPTTEGVET